MLFVGNSRRSIAGPAKSCLPLVNFTQAEFDALGGIVWLQVNLQRISGHQGENMMKIGYVNVFVSKLDEAVTFYTEVLGLQLRLHESDFGYASFEGQPISFALAETDDPALVGRHTGLGFMVADIHARHQALTAKGVVFEMAPTQQPWGGTLALFKDPDGNIFYLDPGHSDHH